MRREAMALRGSRTSALRDLVRVVVLVLVSIQIIDGRAFEPAGARAEPTASTIVMDEQPLWQESEGRLPSKIDRYYWYHGTYALFQFGGRERREWNARLHSALIATQRHDHGDEDGSWDPIDEWGIAGGRVYTTALGAMTPRGLRPIPPGRARSPLLMTGPGNPSSSDRRRRA